MNVLTERAPKIPQKFRDSKSVFLANTHPALQQQMLEHLPSAHFVVADTMNLWIQTERHELGKLLKRIDGLVLNDGEARLLTERENDCGVQNGVRDAGDRPRHRAPLRVDRRTPHRGAETSGLMNRLIVCGG